MSPEQLELVFQELDSLRKQCEEYKETITFQANEIRNLRKSLSDNICQNCKSRIGHTIYKELEPFTIGSSVSVAASALWKAAHSPALVYPNSNASGFESRHSPLSDSFNSRHIAVLGGNPSPPSQLSTPINVTIAASPTISFNCRVKKELDVSLVHSFRHKKRVYCIRYSPDGRHLAATCGRAIHIYDVETWRLIYVLQDISQNDKDGEIFGVRFSIDGTYLAAASADRLIRVWEISRNHVRNVFKGHGHFVRSLDFSPNGRLLASASFDGTARTWSMRDGTSRVLANTSDRTNRSLYSVAFSPDGIYLVAGGQDRVLGIWNVQTGQLIKWLEGHTSTVRGVSFTPDGKGLVSGSWDYTLKYWDISSLHIHQRSRSRRGKKISQTDGDFVGREGPRQGMQPALNFKGHTSLVNVVAVSPNGRWVVSGSSDESVCIWDARNADMQCILQAHNREITSVHMSPVGNYLVSSDQDGQVRVWRCK